MDRDTKVFVGIMVGILVAGGIGHVVVDQHHSTTAAITEVRTTTSPTTSPTRTTTPRLTPSPTLRPAHQVAPTPQYTALSQGSPEPPSVVDNAPAVGCGVEREALKVGRDPGASSVPLTPRSTTIATLSSYANDTGSSRVAPVETTVWRITATLTDYKLENDSDYHLVIEDGQGRTMIAELADPACAHGSPWLSQIVSARRAFDARFQPSDRFRGTSVLVTLTGVGFFDFDHGQRGVAPNAVELHPVLSIAFG